MKKQKLFILLIAMISGLAFAPLFIFPTLFALAFLAYKIRIAKTIYEAILLGFIFGLGHFLSSLYWIALGVTVYIEEFWWAFPFALFGIPAILACFVAGTCAVSWYFRKNNYYNFIFSLSWIFFEWLRSWLFTGLPWNLLGYALSFSDILIQFAGICGIYGLSFIVIYVAISPMSKNKIISILNSIFILLLISFYGIYNLKKNPVEFSDIKIRLVQPSIQQSSKWNEKDFIQNIQKHIDLSMSEPFDKIDLIIWSEAALTIPYRYIKEALTPFLEHTGSILITGSVEDNGKKGEDFEIYTSLYVANYKSKLFEYHKSHLVPFGEYMPLKKFLPLKKLTHGFIDYTEGKQELVHLDKLNLTIKPLICYESIFPAEVRISNKSADLMINITNDAWYGNSSGPYQHFEISRMRSVENGLPMIRTANNGISAIIDGNGRIVKKLSLNEIGYIEGFLPKKLNNITICSEFGDISFLIIVVMMFLTELIFHLLFKNRKFFHL